MQQHSRRGPLRTGGARIAASAGAIVLAGLCGPQVAAAHDVVLGSNPENGGVVQEFPQRVELEFSGEIQDGFNTVALSVNNGGETEVLYSAEPELRGRDVILELPAGVDAGPGEYRVGFQIISSDGHSTKGMTKFTYAPDGTQAPAESAGSEEGAAQAQEDGGFPALAVAVAAVAVLGAAAAAVLARRRRAPAGAEPSEASEGLTKQRRTND